MRIAILTTDTAHHRYFLRELDERLPSGSEIVLNLFETKGYPWKRMARRHLRQSLPNLWRGLALNPYLQSQALARREAAFEEPRFFADGDRALPQDLPSHNVHSVNDSEAGKLLAAALKACSFVIGNDDLALGVPGSSGFSEEDLGTMVEKLMESLENAP